MFIFRAVGSEKKKEQKKMKDERHLAENIEMGRDRKANVRKKKEEIIDKDSSKKEFRERLERRMKDEGGAPCT